MGIFKSSKADKLLYAQLAESMQQATEPAAAPAPKASTPAPPPPPMTQDQIQPGQGLLAAPVVTPAAVAPPPPPPPPSLAPVREGSSGAARSTSAALPAGLSEVEDPIKRAKRSFGLGNTLLTGGVYQGAHAFGSSKTLLGQ